MTPDEVRLLLESLQRGHATIDEVSARLARELPRPSAATTDAHVDVDRQRRCGFPEVVFCEGKTAESVVEIFSALVDAGQSCFGTRISPEQAERVLAQFPRAHYNSIARTICAPEGPGEPSAGFVAVVTAGTSDRPVAEEAFETLRWMGCRAELIHDVGVAGPHRLREQYHRFADADVVVVVAGMEGALPSVVGGYVDCPVIAVPTSVGYGASLHGLAALLGMLNSCAANVTVVNIDGGFKGGYIAGLIAQRSHVGTPRPDQSGHR
ncbi:MAG: nickel pincer cofactor biosynthesis protein LarB [Planctomycetes bacterium]|nr:nickel pincer cofactor biosynthesis protein LarB [Planctomycetota bacterium]